MRTFYEYDYRVLEAAYRRLVLPLDEAELKLVNLLGAYPNGPPPPGKKAEVLPVALYALIAVQSYLEGDINQIFAEKGAAATLKLKHTTKKYDADNVRAGRVEYTSRQHHQIHYLTEVRCPPRHNLVCDRNMSDRPRFLFAVRVSKHSNDPVKTSRFG